MRAKGEETDKRAREREVKGEIEKKLRENVEGKNEGTEREIQKTRKRRERR